MTQLDEAIRLSNVLKRESKFLSKNDAYFEGDQPLKFISPILEKEFGYRVSPVVINLGRYAVDVYENRLDIEGFRFAQKEESDSELWQVWEANDGPFLQQQSHREGLALSRAYAIVGEGAADGDPPVITVESPFEAIHEDDPRTRQVRHGIKRWTEPDKSKWMTFFHTDGWTTWVNKDGEWEEDDSHEEAINLCRLQPLINDPRILGRIVRGRSDQRLGRSVFHDIIPIMDALNKFASDMMVSAEFHIMPRRWATGIKESDFIDEAGKPLDTFSTVAGRIWGTESEKAKFGQFDEADLENFHNTIKLLSQVAAQQLALPPNYVTFGTDGNPASADAIRSAESQLVKRAERKQQVLSTAWERVQRLVLITLGYPDTLEARSIETIWRDPSTPTVAQKADAIAKMVATKDPTGRPLLPLEQAWSDMGYTAQQQERLRDWANAAREDPQLAGAMRGLQDASGGS